MCRTARFQLRRRTRGLNRNPPAFRCVGERYRRSVQPLPPGTRRGVFVKARTAFLVAFVMLATAALVVVSQSMPDPLAKFRTPDGRLMIPGRALTPELQRLLFHGNDLGPLTNVTFLLPVRSSYPTERLVAISFASPNLNVFVHPRQAPETWGSAIDHVLRVWFPPVDWHEVAVGFRNSIRDGVGWFFDLFTMNAKADALTVDSTTVAVVDPAAATCTTSQSAAAGDNAVLVMLSNRGPTAYASVTYGSVSLSLIPGTATSGTGIVRSEIWFFQGAIRGGRHALPRDGNHVDGRQRHRLGHLRGSRVAHPELRRCVGELLSDRRGWDVGHGCELVEHVRRGGVRLHARCDERCDLQCHPHRHHDPCGSHDDREHRHDGLHRHARYDRIQLGAHRQRSIRHSGDVPGSEFDDYDHRGRRRAHRGDDHQSRRIELDGQRPVDQPIDLRLVGRGDEHGDDSRCDKRDAHIRGTGWRSERVQQSHAGRQCDYEHHVHDGSKPVEDGSDPHDPQLDRPGNEFTNVSFNSSAASVQTFTMATRALIWGGTLTISDGSSTTALATANLGLTGGALSVGNGGILTANASTVTVSSVAMTGGTSGTITLTTGSFTSSGNWDTSGAGSVFTKGTSTVTMSGVANIAILNASNNFNSLVISAAGTVTQTGLVDVSGTLTVNAGSILASGTFTLTVATLAANMAGGITGGAAGTKTITGNVSIAASGYFGFGATTWNFGGLWTNSSASGSWAAGTGAGVFNSRSAPPITFSNLGASEFNNVQFSTTAAATFTMATNGLRWGGTLTLNNNATLSTANLALTAPAGNLTVNNGATLTAGTSAVSVTNVTMTGGTSGTITASGSWTVAGNWDTSGVGSVLTATSSTVTMSGAARTVKILNASNGFGALTISGTVTTASAITLAGLLTVSGTFDTTATNYGLSVGGGLTGSGAAGVLRSNGSTVSVAGTVSVNNAGGALTIGNGGVLTANASAVSVSNVTMTGGASGTLTLTTGAWTVTGNWDTSGAGSTLTAGTSTVTMTGAGNTVRILNASNGFAALTINGAVSAASALTTSGLVTVSGTLDTIGANSGLTIGGGLTVNGATGILRANGSTVSIAGNVNVNNAAGYITSTAGGSWTASGSWTNSSTSGSWSFAAPITFNSSSSRTMTWGNPTLEFGGNVTFNSGGSTVTFTMAANSLDVGGTLTIAGGAGTTTLNTSGSNLAINAVTFVVDAGGAFTANGSTITVTSIDTHLGTFTVGGSTVVVNASGGSINLTQTVNNLTVSPAISTTFTGSLTWTGTLVFTNAGTVAFGTSSLTSSGAATFTFASATITMSSGNWDTSSATTFTATSSTVTFSGTGNLRIGGSASFGVLAVSGGTRTLQSQLTTTGLLTLSGGTLAKGTNAPTVNAGLTMSGGALTSTSGVVSITGNVSITAPASYIVFGSESWTVSGSWTNNSTSASWSIRTPTVAFNAASAPTT